MENNLLLYNIGILVTGKELPKNNSETSMENIEVLEKAFLVVEEGKVLDHGTGNIPDKYQNKNYKEIDVKGNVITPGIVDSHMHLVHYGSRENELTMKLQGVPYLEILRNGGGILSTVRATRKASKEQLYEKAFETLNRMLIFGVTTVESKSGYGLDLENEIKQLEVNQMLNLNHPIDVVSTFMGAHAIPEEYRNRNAQYVQEVLNMLPIIKEKQLAEFCDVFCEDEVFSVEETRKILNRAKELGYKVKLHGDEIISLGGGELAGEIKAISAEHLMAVSDKGIESLKDNGVIANILPATSFNLGKSYAPVRKMIDKGIEIALSSDYNPGSCPCENMQFVMNIASCQLRMTPKEIFKAVCLNGARAINREKEIGSLERGKYADFIIYDTKNIEYIFYNFGTNHVKDVFKKGIQVVEDRCLKL